MKERDFHGAHPASIVPLPRLRACVGFLQWVLRLANGTGGAERQQSVPAGGDEVVAEPLEDRVVDAALDVHG